MVHVLQNTPRVLLTGLAAVVLAAVCRTRAAELFRCDHTLFGSETMVVARSNGVVAAPETGLFVVTDQLRLNPPEYRHIVYRVPADNVFLGWSARAGSRGELTAAVSAQSKGPWSTLCVLGDKSLRTHVVESPIGIISVPNAGKERFVRLSVRRTNPNGEFRTVFGLYAMGERTCGIESGTLALPESKQPLWLWLKSDDVHGAPPANAVTRYQPPETVAVEPVQTGTLQPGAYTYVVRPYARNAAAGLQTTGLDLSRPGFFFEGSCGPGGCFVLDWAKGAERIGIFWGMADDLAKGNDTAETDDLEETFGETEERQKQRGFEIWRRGPGEETFRLAASIPDPALRRWTDPGTVVPDANPLDMQDARDVNICGAPGVAFGTLPPGTYYYRFAAILPQGLTEACPPVEVTVKTGWQAVNFRLRRVFGACGYAVWRSTDAAKWENSLIAVLAEDQLCYPDTGLPMSRGTRITLQFRAAVDEAKLAAAPWQPLRPGQTIKLPGGTRRFAYRVRGVTDLVFQRQRTVRVTVSDTQPRAAALSPTLYDGVGTRLAEYMAPAPHAWHRLALLAPAAVNAAKPGAPVDFNAVELYSRGGSHMQSRDFDIQVHNPITGRFEVIAEVRRLNRRLSVLLLDRAIHGRVRAVAAYAQKNAYQMDWAPIPRPALIPAAITDVTLNGTPLAGRPLFRNYIDGGLPVPVGESEIGLTLTGMPVEARPGTGQTSVLLTVALGSSWDAAADEDSKPARVFAEKRVELRVGESRDVRETFTVPEPGLYRVHVTARPNASAPLFYDFAYYLRAGNALRVECLHPSYRGDLFASDPDRSFRFRIEPAWRASAPVTCRLVENGTGQNVWSGQVRACAAAPATVTVPATDLRYGGFTFRATAPNLGTAEMRLRVLPKVPGTTDVCLRADGVMLRDGKPFLPLVMWYGLGHWRASNTAAQWLSGCGLNTLSGKFWTPPTDAFLADMETNGLLMSTPVPYDD